MTQQLPLFDAEPPRRGEYLVPPDARLANCVSCGRTIVWIRTPKGRPIPLATATIQQRGGQRYALSHFTDCPEAQDWRKR